MLMLIWFSSSCNVWALHTSSLCVFTMISLDAMYSLTTSGVRLSTKAAYWNVSLFYKSTLEANCIMLSQKCGKEYVSLIPKGHFLMKNSSRKATDPVNTGLGHRECVYKAKASRSGS